MMPIKQQWQNLTERIDAMSLRERGLIFLAAALLLVMLVNSLLIKPALTRQKTLTQQVVQAQSLANAMQAQIQQLVKAGSADPDAPLHARMEQLQSESAEAEKTMSDLQSGLVSPRQMPAMLEDILRRNRAVKLISLKTLPVENIAESISKEAASGSDQKTPQDAVPATAIYRHGVEITVEGTYMDLLRYLNAMESSPWRMFWGQAELVADKYPKTKLKLNVYTFSLDKAWLAL